MLRPIGRIWPLSAFCQSGLGHPTYARMVVVDCRVIRHEEATQGLMPKSVMDMPTAQPFDAAAMNSRRRFEGGSVRHKAAMAVFLGSRRLEVAPFRFLLTENRHCLLDLFAGTGFVSGAIGRFFGETILVEPHVEPAVPTAGGRSCRRQACALSASSFEFSREADLAVCLAGFHHVLGPGGPEDVAAHHLQRLEALRLWRARLAPGGRLVIADVPAPGTRGGWADGPLDDLRDAAQAERLDDTSSKLAIPDCFARLHACSRLHDYLSSITSLCRDLQLAEAEPGTFFDRVVSMLSPYGHVAYFNSPQELVCLFRESGFKNIRSFVAPTPWLFPTKADAVWFIHELLCIGQPWVSPNELPARERELVQEGISDHLNLRQLPDGSWAISWKLMYVLGDRP